MGAHSATVTDFGTQDLEDGIHQGGFAHPGPAGHDQQLVGQRQRDRRPLTRRQRHPDFLLNPAERALGINHWPRRLLVNKRSGAAQR